MSMGSEPLEEEIVRLKAEVNEATEKAALAAENGCPTKTATGKPCAGCAAAGARIRNLKVA